MNVLYYKYNKSLVSTSKTFTASQKIPVGFYYVSTPTFPQENVNIRNMLNISGNYIFALL